MKKKFVLVVEDEKALASIYKSELEAAGYEVELLFSGDKVVSKILKRQPDLLVLDLLLPYKNGFEILEDIKKEEKIKNLQVIIASNLSQDIDKEKASQYNICDYFIKSDVSIDEMIKKIKKCL